MILYLKKEYDGHKMHYGIHIFHPDNGTVITSLEPLMVNLNGTFIYRPNATVNIPNMFLASDYVRTSTDVACMEAANEAARRAVNGVSN